MSCMFVPELLMVLTVPVHGVKVRLIWCRRLVTYGDGLPAQKVTLTVPISPNVD